jgi:quinoprotein glucose dehydrogenase
MMDTTKYPEAKNWGSLNLGGAMVTGGGLTFIAATRDNHLRAFETATGKLLWEELLPASAQATPMSYVYKGKQYIVIAAGGHGKFETKQGDYVVAYSLR